MKVEFNFGLFKAHVVMNLVLVDKYEKKVLGTLLKGKSVIRGGGGKLAPLTDLCAARIFEANLKQDEAILGIWKLDHNKGLQYYYLFTPISDKLKIIDLDEIGDDTFVNVALNNYKKL